MRLLCYCFFKSNGNKDAPFCVVLLCFNIGSWRAAGLSASQTLAVSQRSYFPVYKLFMSNFSSALDKLAEIRVCVSLLTLIPTNAHILIGNEEKKKKKKKKKPTNPPCLHLCALDGMD